MAESDRSEALPARPVTGHHVRGNGGVGKPALVRRWETAAPERASVVTSYV
ncbi:hypothetical protein [Streptomyces sp. NPDC057428]|uniref:hypothetical protein n=1 Tax=Streptomyces sp. NPDC057428 TaxID=3346129 RepID=UPI0036892264